MKNNKGAKRVQVRVVRRFKEGWLCAEAVVLAVLEQFNIEAEPQLMRAVSALNFGMGGTGSEHCGAFTGGVITLGVLLGRQTQKEDLFSLHAELIAFRKWYLDSHGSLNCRELVDSFGELRESECVGLAATTAKYLVSRQEILQNADMEPISKRRCVLPGQCPFTGGS